MNVRLIHKGSQRTLPQAADGNNGPGRNFSHLYQAPYHGHLGQGTNTPWHDDSAVTMTGQVDLAFGQGLTLNFFGYPLVRWYRAKLFDLGTGHANHVAACFVGALTGSGHNSRITAGLHNKTSFSQQTPGRPGRFIVS